MSMFLLKHYVTIYSLAILFKSYNKFYHHVFKANRN